jgi:hypothetical protein
MELSNMVRYKEIPDLLVQYMEMCEEAERWITVYEFRTCFHLDESSAHAISGFLNRIYYRPFLSYAYRVKKIEKIIMYTPTRRIINRYLVKKKPEIKEVQAGHPTMATAPRDLHTTGLPGMVDRELCTDYDAVEIFNKVLRK